MQNKINLSKTHFLVHYSIQTLDQYMRSGVGYMINTFLNSNDRLIGLRYYTQEIMLLLDFIIKAYYLKKENSTYAQYFYSFERQSQSSKPFYSAILLSLYPYLRGKMQAYYNKLKLHKPYQQMNKFQKGFFLLFPLFHTIIELIELILKFKYLLFSGSEYYDLLYWVLKVKLNYKKSQQKNNALLDLINKPFILAIFIAYKALNWYYSSRSAQNNYVANQNVPPPFADNQLRSKNTCPLCSKKINNPAVLSSSGYVYCYNCITHFVKDNKKCPISNIPCTQQSIHVIYS